MSGHWPMTRKPSQSYSENAAHYVSLEAKFVNSRPDHKLALPQIKSSINPKHLPRIESAWMLVRKNAQAFYDQAKLVHDHWVNAPKLSDEEQTTLFQNAAEEMAPEYGDSPNENLRSPDQIREGIRESISQIQRQYLDATILDLKPKPSEKIPSEDSPDPFASEGTDQIAMWQQYDRSFRETLYRFQKEYLVALRTYYELLLERNKETEDYVLPPETGLRSEVAIANRYLRLIDTVTQALAFTKGGHHHQKKDRFRKTKVEAYFAHEVEVVFATIRDVVPHIIEKEKLPIRMDINILIVIAALHDLLEDSPLSIESIEEKIKGLADHYDGSLLGSVEGGFGLDANGICKQYLDIIRSGDIADIRSALRIVSKNSELDDYEKLAAAKAGICNKELIIKFAGLQPQKVKEWKFGNPTKTFKNFPEEHDKSKLTQFLIRLNAIKGRGVAKQYALMVKNEDRSSNIKDSEKMKVEKQFETLRETTTRLIAWQMLDHDHSYPVYNTLPELIKTTIGAYTRLAFQHADKFTEKDNQYLQQLLEWQAELQTRGLVHEEPESVRNPVEQWRQATREKVTAQTTPSAA